MSVYRPYGIRQEISAGGNFDGTAPGTTPAFANQIQKYPAAAAGGLFNPYELEFAGEGKDKVVDLIGIELSLADQTSWNISKIDPDGNTVVLYSGTDETSFVVNLPDKTVMLNGSTLKLVTSGASTAMVATMMFDPHMMED